MAKQKPGAEVIEIRDKNLNEVAIQQRLTMAMAERTYALNVTAVGPDSLRIRQTAIAHPPTESLNQLMINLLAQEPLHEQPFTSTAPLVGPLIVALRRAWNWMSTRWYVLPIMNQQAETNHKMILLLNELVQQHELDTQRIAELEARLAQLNEQQSP